jgi:hypothetical protein
MANHVACAFKVIQLSLVACRIVWASLLTNKSSSGRRSGRCSGRHSLSSTRNSSAEGEGTTEILIFFASFLHSIRPSPFRSFSMVYCCVISNDFRDFRASRPKSLFCVMPHSCFPCEQKEARTFFKLVSTFKFLAGHRKPRTKIDFSHRGGELPVSPPARGHYSYSTSTN